MTVFGKLAMFGAAATVALASCSRPAPRWSSSAAQGDAKTKAQAKAPERISPARMLAVPDRKQATLYFEDPNGDHRLVAHGLRMVDHPDGSIELSKRLFPARTEIRAVELPDHLGGGYLFYAPADKTKLWRAQSWTGDLEPIATVSMWVDQVTPGFDRLYLRARHSQDLAALELDEGQLVDPGSLPDAPGFSSMAFLDAWTGAVESDVRGVLVTFDAGSSWHPIGIRSNAPALSLAPKQERIVVRTVKGNFLLGKDGRFLRQGSLRSEDSMFSGAADSSLTSWAKQQEAGQRKDDKSPRARARSLLGGRPLRLATLHGWPHSKETALVAAAGTLAEVNLTTGETLELIEDAYPGGASCQGIALGRSGKGVGAGFVCGEQEGPTTVYAVRQPLRLEPVLSFDHPRYVAASGNGGIVVRGSCSGETGKPSSDATTYCVRAPRGKQREVRVRGDLGVERVAILKDGRVAVLVPPRLGAKGQLTLVSEDGSAKTVKLKLPKEAESSIRALLKKGFWADGWQQRDKDTLAGWVIGGGPFIGVRVDLDGKVRVGELADDIDRTLVSGQLALALGRGGTALETFDGGFSWLDIDVPPTFGDRGGGLPRLGAKGARDARGCSPVGCGFGNWLRVGWQTEDAGDDEKKDEDEPEGGGRVRAKLSDDQVVEDPPLRSRPSSVGARWLLRCAYDGTTEVGARLPVRPGAAGGEAPRIATPLSPFGFGRHYPRPPTAQTIQSSAWAPFNGTPPPAKGGLDVGFDFGTGSHYVQLRAYVWGPRKGSEWERRARWAVRVADRFRVQGGIWSTASSRSPWADAVSAAQSFGQLTRWGGYANWQAVLEPSGRAGVLVQNVRGTNQAFIVEDGRAVQTLRGNNLWGLNQLAGFVRVGGSWYIGARAGSRLLRVYRVDGSELHVFAEFPMVGGRSGDTRLVRSTSGDALGVWMKSNGLRGSSNAWYVFPIDLNTGHAGEALLLSPQQLGTRPARCQADDEGWLLEGHLSVEPYVEFLGGGINDRLRVNTVEARVVAGAEGLCLDGLAARLGTRLDKQARLSPAPAGWSRGKETAPLAVTDRKHEARRFGFRCAL